jgi:branched-chain amino acid transport system substrate-binding protein
VRRAGLPLATIASGALLAVGALLTGCGSKLAIGVQISGRTLTIYGSAPLHGASRVNAEAAMAGASMALSAIHGRIGKYRINFKPLDDSTAQRGEWDPGQTTVNARVAVQDRSTIAYIGELNSGASAVSIPLLNRAGIAQVSPASTAVGLTDNGPGAYPGEPQKYYPTGVRTFVRLVPSDAIQALAQVRLQQSVGCRRTYVLDDGEVDGVDTAASFSATAQSAALQVAAVQAFDAHATDYQSLGTAVALTGSDCVLISAITESNAVPLTKQLAASLPHAKIFGSAGVAESTYTDPLQGGIPSALDSRLVITVATLDPAAYPEAGRRMLLDYAKRYGPPQPAAIWGYEAMSVLLGSIARASDSGTRAIRRSGVVSALFATRNRRSVLGTYSIKADGATTIRRYGVYRVLAGRLSFWKVIDT